MPVTTELAPVDRAYAHVMHRQLVTSVGVNPGLLRELTNQDVECLLTYAGTLDDMSRWVVADLLVWAEERAAEQTGSRSGRIFWDARDKLWEGLLMACKMDISKYTAYNMVSTARAFPWQRRRHTRTLSFEHHRLVSGREPDEQEYWLDLADDGEWSVHQLRTHLYSQGDPLTPNLSVVLTPHNPWPEERVEKEVYAAFSLSTRYDTVEAIKQLVNRIIEEIRNEYQNTKNNGRRHEASTAWYTPGDSSAL